MNATSKRPTSKRTPCSGKGTKRGCATCNRRLFRIWDRETLTAEYLCVSCTCFAPTNPNRK